LSQRFPREGIQYPRLPGHEVVGLVDAVGAGVTQWKSGQRVGVGWHGGHCGTCDNCRNGNFFGCTVNLQITGISFDGGYADYLVAPAIALARVPEELSAVEAAPLMCAGITTYNALRNSPRATRRPRGRAGPGRTRPSRRAIRREDGFQDRRHRAWQDKEALAKQLGAWRYLDSQTQDPAAELQKLGGAKTIIATVTNGDAMSAVVGGLGVNGVFLVIGAAQS
jgi:D-arabinose 1-dehydrogenase-like Zn-dependent alcohol dehydrogenase